MKIRKTAAVAAVAGGLVATLMPLASAQAAPTAPAGVALYADGTRLGRFNAARPSGMTPIGGKISGLSGDTSLIGIDRRVQNGRLYGVGERGGIYLLSGSAATKVGQISVPLDGSSAGVDFNPAANALRIVSDSGQNLRQPFTTGDGPDGVTQVDTPLAYGTTPAEGITGAAYTNNDLSDTTATTLFDLDSNLDQIAVQSPANAGSLVATGKLGTGAGVMSGFDIYSELDGARTVANIGLAAIPVGTNYRFHEIDLLTGDATYIGRFPERVTDIAIDLDR